MNSNLEYEKANVAVNLIKNGMTITDAVENTNAAIQIVNIMIGNQELITEDVFVDNSIRLQRDSICASCNENVNNTCMVCACPLPTITNMKFKECPLEKW